MSDAREALAEILALAEKGGRPLVLARQMGDIAARALAAQAEAESVPSGSAAAWRDWTGMAEADRSARVVTPYVAKDGTGGYFVREGDVTVSAIPYRWDGQDHWQFYVRCGCPAGLHAFPHDVLDEGFDKGLTSCQRLLDHHRQKTRRR